MHCMHNYCIKTLYPSYVAVVQIKQKITTNGTKTLNAS